MQQQTKLESLSEIVSTNKHRIYNQTVRVSMHMYEVSKLFGIRLDHWRTMLEI